MSKLSVNKSKIDLEFRNDLENIDLYQHVIESIPLPILIVDLEGQVIFGNSEVSQLLGYSISELIQAPIGRLIPDCTDVFLAFRNGYFSKSKEPLYFGKTKSIKIPRKDGSALYINLKLTSFDVEEGRFVMVSLIDISDHQRVESELTRSNNELDQFAYVASHDLKAPLRGIDNLVTWISEDIEDKDLVTDHLQMMRIRLQRMRALLDDLLEYSRVGKVEYDVSNVDVHYVIKDLFQQSSPPKQFCLEFDGENITFDVLATPFTQVLRNLINNAIKHNDKENGIINVEVKEEGGFVHIDIKDNGPGIEEQYYEKVFGMFEKLKSKDDVEGSGMGLAMVKKITESQGGAINVKSIVGEGSVFSVVWPKHQECDHC
ncbi:hypothetical protein A9Q81_13470 [Gammaproteobacteria bacterium 42_54_T18]|nr:hypothetical protein A9Q81_13470 [Gammaproteobacteria bacterium 42_54_T18]